MPETHSATTHMHPITLAFDDAALEARYAVERFHAACAPFVALCGFAVIADVTMAVILPEMLLACATDAVSTVACIAARLWLDRMADQENARILFGRSLVVVVLLAAISYLIWAQDQAPKPGSQAIVATWAVVVGLLPVYLRFSALDGSHRLASDAIIVIFFCLSPPLSDLGHPTERDGPRWHASRFGSSENFV